MADQPMHSTRKTHFEILEPRRLLSSAYLLTQDSFDNTQVIHGGFDAGAYALETFYSEGGTGGAASIEETAANNSGDAYLKLNPYKANVWTGFYPTHREETWEVKFDYSAENIPVWHQGTFKVRGLSFSDDLTAYVPDPTNPSTIGEEIAGIELGWDTNGRVPHFTVLRDVCWLGVTAHIAEDGEVWHPAIEDYLELKGGGSRFIDGQSIQDQLRVFGWSLGGKEAIAFAETLSEPGRKGGFTDRKVRAGRVMGPTTTGGYQLTSPVDVDVVVAIDPEYRFGSNSGPAVPLNGSPEITSNVDDFYNFYVTNNGSAQFRAIPVNGATRNRFPEPSFYGIVGDEAPVDSDNNATNVRQLNINTGLTQFQEQFYGLQRVPYIDFDEFRNTGNFLLNGEAEFDHEFMNHSTVVQWSLNPTLTLMQNGELPFIT